MSIIQTIRDKGAKISVILIALALLGFILTDYVAGKNRGQSGGAGSKNIGSVNGTSINMEDFQRDVDNMEANMKQQGYPQGSALTQQAVQQTWDQSVNRILLQSEFNKLGLDISKKELGDILYGANAPEDLKKQFTDESGQYNPIKAKQAIDAMLKDKKTPQAQKDQFNNYISQLQDQRKSEKYNSLLANSSNVPRWFVEKQNADNSQMAKVSVVKEVYSAIPDSAVKIEDKEIADYISKHKDDFKQTESRNINYVSFSAAPNAADSAEAKAKLMALKPQLDSAKDLQEFFASQGSGQYYDGYINGKAIQIAAKDSIFKTPVGSTYGPYLDGPTYTLARMMGVRQMPDTVKVRHILIATSQVNPQTRQTEQIRDEAVARKLIDSIATAIRNGANFDSVCAKLSEDPGSKDKGGVYDNVPSGQMTPPFNDFIFLKPVGTKDTVKSEFGYHYVEVLSQKGGGTGYKIAYLPMDIVVSQETDNAAMNKANQFAGDSRDQKSFDATYEKTLKPQGIVKNVGLNIKPNDGSVQGLASREFVRDIYKAKKGEVLKPEKIGEEYVVAVVTETFDEGTQSVATARMSVEPLLRNQKKAEILKKKIGKVTTLEAAASALGGKPIETIDSVRMSLKTTSALGYEPRVIGAAFNPANKGKVVPEALEGVNGVYVIRVDNVSATQIADNNVAEQRKAMYQQAKQQAGNPLNALKSNATIKDKRADRY